MCLHLLQVTIASSSVFPRLYLTVEESQDGAVGHDVLLAFSHLLTCGDLESAQAVFIQVVGVDFLYAQRGVAVASPSSAEVQFVEDSSYAVSAREDKAECIVLAVACIRELYLSEQRGEEGTWRTESVDAQCVVRSVLVGPFVVVDESWRQRVEVEVAHAVRTDDHGRLLLFEGIDDTLQCVWSAVEVVAVELYGEASAPSVADSHVPASADT